MRSHVLRVNIDYTNSRTTAFIVDCHLVKSLIVIHGNSRQKITNQSLLHLLKTWRSRSEEVIKCEVISRVRNKKTFKTALLVDATLGSRGKLNKTTLSPCRNFLIVSIVEVSRLFDSLRYPLLFRGLFEASDGSYSCNSNSSINRW